MTTSVHICEKLIQSWCVLQYWFIAFFDQHEKCDWPWSWVHDICKTVVLPLLFFYFFFFLFHHYSIISKDQNVPTHHVFVCQCHTSQCCCWAPTASAWFFKNFFLEPPPPFLLEDRAVMFLYLGIKSDGCKLMASMLKQPSCSAGCFAALRVLTPSLPQPVKFPGWKMHRHACKQYIFRSHSTSTFSVMHFDENSFTCQCKKDQKA